MFFQKRVHDGGGERERVGVNKKMFYLFFLISFKSKFTLKVHERIESMF